MDPATRRLLTIILLAALSVRLGWSLSRPTTDAAIDQLPDQREYLDIASSLLHGDGFSFTDPRFNARIYAYRTPGYPTFVAACLANVTVVRIVQSILDTSTILAAFLLARRWLTPRESLIAALFVAFNPFLVYFSALILTETLFTTMLAWGLVLITSTRLRFWLAGGAILALCVLVRPGALAMPIIIAILAAITNRRSDPAYQRKWPLPVGATMLLFMLVTLAPWAYRNSRVVGASIWTTSNAGITAYDGFNPDATGASDQSFIRSMPQLRRMTETERNEYLANAASEFRRQYPRRAMELALTKIARTWSPRPLSDEFSKPLYVAAALAYSVPFDVFVLIGLFRAARPVFTAKLLLISPAIYLTLASAMSVGSLRYRVPAEVPISVLAAAGLSWSWQQLRTRDAGVAATA